MATNYHLLQAQQELTDNNLDMALRKLKEPSSLSLNQKATSDLKNQLVEAKKNQQSNIKIYENNEKKFKVLKKYGEVLARVEKLLGLIPSDLENLSMDQLIEKMEELVKTRKKNMNQFNLIFFQNLLSDMLTNLVNVEKDFQTGAISSQEALAKVKEAKHDVKEHVNDMPPIMHEPLKQTSELIKMYENSYSQISEATSTQEQSVIIKTEIKPEHELLFNKLNNKTQELLSNVNNLSLDMARFEPQVDLTKLSYQLKDTNDLVNVENWDVDELDSAVEKLNLTTNTLTDEQIEKNKESEKITNSIEELTTKTIEISKETIKEVSEEVFKQAIERAEKANENVQEINEMPVENNMYANDIKKQFANTLISQLSTDKEFTDVVAVNPDAATEFKDDQVNQEAQNAANEIIEKVEKYELENGMIKVIDPNNPEEDKENEGKDENGNPTGGSNPIR